MIYIKEYDIIKISRNKLKENMDYMTLQKWKVVNISSGNNGQYLVVVAKNSRKYL